jgi:hypothetical protein
MPAQVEAPSTESTEAVSARYLAAATTVVYPVAAGEGPDKK